MRHLGTLARLAMLRGGSVSYGLRCKMTYRVEGNFS